MIKVVCGEDFAASRDYFLKLKKDYQRQGYEILEGSSENFFDLIAKVDYSSTLFAQKRAFFFSNILKKLRRKKEFRKTLERFAKSEDVLIIYEQMDKYELGKSFSGAEVVNFKLSENIWKLLDSFAPSRRQEFLHSFKIVCKHQSNHLIFHLLYKRLRELILVKTGARLSSPFWLRRRLERQAEFWDEQKLYSFIEHFAKIDRQIKTSETPYTLADLMEIVFYYAL